MMNTSNQLQDLQLESSIGNSTQDSSKIDSTLFSFAYLINKINEGLIEPLLSANNPVKKMN